jgi:hypothetical protein
MLEGRGGEQSNIVYKLFAVGDEGLKPRQGARQLAPFDISFEEAH